ncbi:MAG: 50S ribosomal protein L6 [Omnitrophica bacterium RBG_13_46_9]|nr:MAG: 50S ribosomal protein L6 [Omnitrophica bacterium RBG_13_46_9]
MSRIGKKPIEIPKNVKIGIADNKVAVEGPKGKMEYGVPGNIRVSLKDNKLFVERSLPEKEAAAIQGVTQRVISNLIKGVTEGYKKDLEIRGVGFKAQAEGKTLLMNLGFSHQVKYPIPDGITINTPKPTIIIVSGIDKVKVGEVSAEIRSYFKPEPYTGKGIRYAGEYVRHKAGKTVAK